MDEHLVYLILDHDISSLSQSNVHARHRSHSRLPCGHLVSCFDEVRLDTSNLSRILQSVFSTVATEADVIRIDPCRGTADGLADHVRGFPFVAE